MAEHHRLSVLRFPLSAILESSANVRTLRVLYRHSGLMAAPAIVQQSGLAKASVAKALKTLGALGYVEASGAGRTTLYQISNSHPMMEELARLFWAEDDRYRAILDSIGASAADMPQVLAVWLYGSVARAEDNELSDVDIAFVVEKRDTEIEDVIRSRILSVGERYVFSPSMIFLASDDIRRLMTINDPWWVSLKSAVLVLHGKRPDWLREDAFGGANGRRRSAK